MGVPGKFKMANTTMAITNGFNKGRKDEFGTKYPRLRRTVSAANFTSAARRGYTSIQNNDDCGKLLF
jgi:hypothetical protein